MYATKVAYSITEGEKNGVRTLFRHASIQMRDPTGDVCPRGLGSLPMLLIILEALGYRENGAELIREPHPGLPGVAAYFQEYEAKTVP